MALVLMTKEISKDVRMLHWPKVPCTIQSSAIEPKSNGYTFEVTYRYSVGGKRYVGKTYRANYTDSEKYSDAEKIQKRFPGGASSSCFVNPTNAADAVLEVQSPWAIAAFAFIPIIFIVIGGGGLFYVWFPRKTRASAGSGEASPISERGVRKLGVGVFLFGLFFLIGVAVTCFWTIPTERKIFASKSWPATPCTILSSRVQSHSDDDGTTYSIDILYTYKVNGQTYTSARYNFVGGSSSGFAGKKKVVDQYRPRSRATCYVNPNDPTEAVLVRGWTTEGIFPFLPVLFLLVGAGGLIGMYKYQRRTQSNEKIWAMKRPGIGTSSTAPHMMPIQKSIVLKPAATARKRFLGMVIFALFWNGFIAIAYYAWLNNDHSICMVLFMIPFIAVGIGVIVGVIYSFLAMFNPSAELELLPGALILGTQATVRWQINGRSDRITKLKIRVEAREEATYQRGTRSATDTNVFQIIDVTEATSAMHIARGEAKFDVPANTMHSFQAPHNKIIWSIKVRGEIPNWPDLNVEYPLDVQPIEVRT